MIVWNRETKLMKLTPHIVGTRHPSLHRVSTSLYDNKIAILILDSPWAASVVQVVTS